MIATPQICFDGYAVCLKCGSPMRLTTVESEHSGYQRRMFECQGCGGTMTEWSRDTLLSESFSRPAPSAN